jgi:hypothetical protein
MLEVIKNALITSYSGMLKIPDMSLVIGDLSNNEFDIVTLEELSTVFEEDNGQDLMLGLFDHAVATDVFKLFTSETYLNALEGSGDLVFVGCYHLGDKDLIIWSEINASGQDLLSEQFEVLHDFIYISSFSVNKSMLDDETNEFNDNFIECPQIKKALYKVLLDE